MNVLLGLPVRDSVRYTTAKVVLVGDSGVGKTGLGWRLAHGKYKKHSSTHGQQFWVVEDLSETRKDDTECEAILWDLAGQDVYRSVHAIFLDDVSLALLLFDPTKRHDTLDGVRFWLKQLAGNNDLPRAALIGARVDRGEAVLTADELDRFCREHDISGGYLSTSAKRGTGLEELMTLIKAQIPWDDLPATVTTSTFKRVKQFVLSLKESDRKNVLVSPTRLRKQLKAANANWKFGKNEMMTAVGHLQNHGYVVILTNSSGQKSILLKPNVLAKLAASIVLEAGKDPYNQGSIDETKLLRGQYEFPELRKFKKADREILLDHAVYRFVEHNICFRETVRSIDALIFPGQIREQRPATISDETEEDVAYVIQGAVENVFSVLAVKLGYSEHFTRVNNWRNQAQYEKGPGEICGFRQIEERAGEATMILYYAVSTPDYVRTLFRGLFETFLREREQDVKVTCYPPVSCPTGHVQERATVIKRLDLGQDRLYCPDCGEQVDLPVDRETLAPGELDRQSVARANAQSQLRHSYEKYLSKIKAHGRDRNAPRCSISYMNEQANWVKRLVKDLRDAGVKVNERAEKIKKDDYLLMVATPDYKQAWKRRDRSLTAEAKVVQSRLANVDQRQIGVIPLLLAGDRDRSLPPELGGVGVIDFRNSTRRTLALFDLALTVHGIEHNNQAFKGDRKTLRNQWKNTLGRMVQKPQSSEDWANTVGTRNRAEYLRLMKAHFSKQDLESLCFQLRIDHEDLAGDTKDSFARALIEYHERRDDMTTLVELLVTERSNVAWPKP